MKTYPILLFLLRSVAALPNYSPTPGTPDIYGTDTPYVADIPYGDDTPYGDTTSYEDTIPDYGTTTRCTPYDEIQYVDKCTDYTDRICYTTYHENCEDVHGQNCKATVSSIQTRPCFDVTEKFCSLKEEVKYEVVDAVITVQKCHKVPERVCNTVYEFDFSDAGVDRCVNVSNLICKSEERTVYEKTCRTETRYDCTENSGYPQVQHYYDGGANSDYRSGQHYEDSKSTSYAGSAPTYGGSAPTYGELSCEKSQDTTCRTKPRQVTTQTCSDHEDRVCERLNERTPKPVERQVCHNEDKKVCKVVQKTQPKQIKTYIYTQVCRPIHKRLCENADEKHLIPSCAPTTRQECDIKPKEKCEDVPKQHCRKIPTTVRREKCETMAKVSTDTHTATYQ